MQRTLEKMRYGWEDEELQAELLVHDPRMEKAVEITAKQAGEDVERLFYLFSHGYSGYGYFSDGDRWQKAKEDILSELETRERWRVSEIPRLLRKHLQFVRDCHTSIGKQEFGGHRGFWYDETIEVRREGERYLCAIQEKPCTLEKINDSAPSEYLFPSLNSSGEAVYRIGVLSHSPPGTVTVEGAGGERAVTIELQLSRSDFKYFSRKVFSEDRIGGVPVQRVRTFSDHATESLQRWVESAENLKDSPCVIVDVRGNRGGNERWPIEWIRRLTGKRADWSFIFSELKSRTTLAGRFNAFAYWVSFSPENEFLIREYEIHEKKLKQFDREDQEPGWTEPLFPDNPTIPNSTTIIMITNGLVGSAGEGFVMRASQCENVVVVGENTRGAITFGNISLHRLPNSGLEVWIPVNFGLFPDLVFREEEGLKPDYWVPAGDALNFTVAAIRSGTIKTVRPLPPEWLEEPFIPEDYRHIRRKLVLACVCVLLGMIWGLFMKRRWYKPLVLGFFWTIIGGIWIVLGIVRDKMILTDVGIGFVSMGIVLMMISLVLGGRVLLRETGD